VTLPAGEDVVGRTRWRAALTIAVTRGFVPGAAIGLLFGGPTSDVVIAAAAIGYLLAVVVARAERVTVGPSAITLQRLTCTRSVAWSDATRRSVVDVIRSRSGRFPGAVLWLRTDGQRVGTGLRSTFGRDLDDPYLWSLLVHLHRVESVADVVSHLVLRRGRRGTMLPDGTVIRVRRAWPNPFEFRVDLDGVDLPPLRSAAEIRRWGAAHVEVQVLAMLDAAVLDST
jgi:hypothetical protein